jgi:hypothetical protein
MVQGLDLLINTDSPELVAMGARGADLVATQFTWPAKALEMLDFYKTLVCES